MKFLCVSCDEAMKLSEKLGPTNGSLTVVYKCPTCGHETAMMTNQHETQLVTSLGVKIGGQTVSACPFAETLESLPQSQTRAHSETVEIAPVAWSEEASKRLERVPEFVRPWAVKGIERFAREKGLQEVTPAIMDEARSLYGM